MFLAPRAGAVVADAFATLGSLVVMLFVLFFFFLKDWVRILKGLGRSLRDRYIDPDCDCPVSTTFEGIVSGNRIEGIFNTYGAPTGHPVTGRWSVERRP